MRPEFSLRRAEMSNGIGNGNENGKENDLELAVHYEQTQRDDSLTEHTI